MLRYRLDDLGWWQFEELCQAMLKAVLGPTVISWGGRADLGRDAYCASDLDLGDGERRPGPFVFQVKFVEDANASGSKPDAALLKAIRAERDAIEKRKKTGKWKSPKHYILLTNTSLTPSLREQTNAIMKEAVADCTVITWGGQDLCDLLDSSPQIRTAFPQILGLRDLNALLADVVNNAVLQRSRAQIERAKGIPEIFVPTEAYQTALRTLDRHCFAVLTGPPEMGKTTIALEICIAKLSEGWEFLDCIHPTDFLQLLDKEKKQIFLVDDAFGSTEYRPDLAKPWGDQLERVLHCLDSRHWLIWTSRPAPLNAAMERMSLQGLAEGFPKPGAVLVDASKLNIEERSKILYRHAKAARLSQAHRDLIKEHARAIVAHNHFTPERIRSFITNGIGKLSLEQIPIPESGSSKLVRVLKGRDSIAELVRLQIETPTARMRRAFDQLAPVERDFLIAMLDARGATVRQHEMFLRMTAGDVEPETIAAGLLDQFIVPNGSELGRKFGPAGYRWVHPSWRDLIIEHLVSDRKDRHRFLTHTGIEGIILAISGFGGASGTREFPLLRGEEDWMIFVKNVGQLLAQPLPRIPSTINRIADMTLQSNEPLRLLGVLKNAAERLERDNSIAHHGPHFRRMLGESLRHCCEQWSRTKTAIPIEVLDEYYSLSSYASELPPGPDLASTWDAYWNSLNAVKLSASYINIELIRSVGRLLRLLQRYEPRFLLFVHFPQAYADAMNPLLAELEARFPPNVRAQDEDELESYSDCQEAIENSEWYANLLSAMEDLVPGKKAQIVAIQERVDDQRVLLKERQEEFDPPPPDEDEARENEREDYFEYKQNHELTEMSRGFDLQDFFSDL